MKYCANCGKEIEDSAAVCSACGAVQPGQPQSAAPQQSPYQQQLSQQPPFQQQPPYQPLNQQPGYNPYGAPVQPTPSATGYLVWSIIVTLFCSIFGILGIVFSAMAMSKTAAYESVVHNIKLAKIFCIIGTVLGVLIIIIYIACLPYLRGVVSNSMMQQYNSLN